MMGLTQARAAGAACGVTRLADVTRLDCLGVPVFQAIRPWTRGLAVHQGKGLTPEAAKIGALMEAVESDHAERFEGARRVCALENLPPGERAPTVADFARSRRRSPSAGESLVWTPAERLIGGGVLWAPFDVVSLDFTRRGDGRLERSSNGLGAGWDREAATVTALLEVIERDALRVWQTSPIERRTQDRVTLSSIPHGWFVDLLARLRQARLSLSVYRAAAVVPLPVFVAELVEFEAGEALRRRVFGSACRASPEEALKRCVVEAAQARLTAISGVRDDIFYEPADRGTSGPGALALPMPTAMRGLSWDEVESAYPARRRASSAELARLLAGAGFPMASIVDLSRSDGGVCVVKALVPGLGATERGRLRAKAA